MTDKKENRTDVLPVIIGLSIGIGFILSFSLLTFPFQQEHREVPSQSHLTATMDRPLSEPYINNEQPLISGKIFTILQEAEKEVSIDVYYPNGTLYMTGQADIGNDGYHGQRIPMETSYAVAGNYGVIVTYSNQVARTSFSHEVEYGQDPEFIRQ